MSPLIVFVVIASYFLLLMLISVLTSRRADNMSFFNANKSSPWYLVAYGMLGASLSGVTFISVPGEVANSSFAYMQFVFGNLVGYWLIAFLLLPFYYRLNLISIYSFLEERLGFYSLKTASFFFLLSKVIGAAFRLYLVALVLQLAFFDAFGLPFSVSVAVSIFLIWLYTYRAGIKTIVWTDTLQTTFLVMAVVFTIWKISDAMGFSAMQMTSSVSDSARSQIFDWEWRSPNFFYKQFFAGIFMAVVINGMDQDIMQKNLTCRNLGEARKNMLVFSSLFVFVVLLFLGLGDLLYQYADFLEVNLPPMSDQVYPFLALNHLGYWVAGAFLIGITAAAFSSADSALTAMTTSFCVDFLGLEKSQNRASTAIRKWVHVGFSVLLVVVILLFKLINDQSVVVAVFKAAGYTYGPILGLFTYAFFVKRPLYDRFVPIVAVVAPLLTFLISANSEAMFWGYKFGFELLIVNGVLTFLGLVAIRRRV
ncbi:sodium:solute symporter [Mangrovibacterium sp.]|uniref:sodium:solute symporter n=1 Tax=Mangrovibacterium sp. TaxID=1961364 RepID=UPI003564B5C1